MPPIKPLETAGRRYGCCTESVLYGDKFFIWLKQPEPCEHSAPSPLLGHPSAPCTIFRAELTYTQREWHSLTSFSLKIFSDIVSFGYMYANHVFYIIKTRTATLIGQLRDSGISQSMNTKAAPQAMGPSKLLNLDHTTVSWLPMVSLSVCSS